MSWGYDDRRGLFFDEEPDVPFSDGECCPNCGYEYFEIRPRYENSDLDGNRGTWMEWFVCTNCGCEY